jgi:hypothetical protein
LTYWYYFWVFDFAIAGGSFVLILVLVAVRGAIDLHHMLADLRREAGNR